MYAVFLYDFVVVPVASLMRLRQPCMATEVPGLIQKRYAQKPKSPV
jgi:hypothetical protein